MIRPDTGRLLRIVHTLAGPLGPSRLLERSSQVAVLSEHLAAIVRGTRGRLIFIGGEAGVGKSALIRLFCSEHADSVLVLSGACDTLFTPRPLGPILDIAALIGGEFEELVERGGRPYEVAAALMRALRSAAPTILILEDVQWADEATLDVLRLVARRIDTLPALVLASYRDDELDRAHPLRVLLGELATGDGIARVKVGALSPAAVAELAEPLGVDAADLYRKTAGNAFFVTEALAARDVGIPPTVRDAVLARATRLRRGAMSVLEAVALVPPQAEPWLLEQLAPDAVECLDECLHSGMLVPTAAGGIAFRHELARLAIEESLTPIRRIALHRRALQVLANPHAGMSDLARLAHHAEAAGDVAAVQRFAPAAGARAALLGAHREAAAQYARALQFGHGLLPLERADLLERHAYECYLTDDFEVSIAAGREAIARYGEAGEPLRQADAMRQLSYHFRCSRSAAEGLEMGRQTVHVLEQLSLSPTPTPIAPGRELALAYSNLARLYMNVEDADATALFGGRALELARQIDDVEVLVNTLDTLGTIELLIGVPEGRARLEQAIELGRAAGLDERMIAAILNLCWADIRTRSYSTMEQQLRTCGDLCSERGLVLMGRYVVAYDARFALDQGRWSEAVQLAQGLLRNPRVVLPRIQALVVVGLVRARRGDPDTWPVLDEALQMAELNGEVQFTGPVAAARAEAAWLEGDMDAVAAATDTVLDLARQRRAWWIVGELACWRWRAGIEEPVVEGTPEPYALELTGQWSQAAEFWEMRGCPYEAALALASADDQNALRGALTEFQRLGARVTAGVVARRLRELGARGLPRGERLGTRSNAAHLTARQMEILELVIQGLRNAEIADRLYLSARTVDHHVSAILEKLGARSRTEAGQQAARLGIHRPL